MRCASTYWLFMIDDKLKYKDRDFPIGYMWKMPLMNEGGELENILGDAVHVNDNTANMDIFEKHNMKLNTGFDTDGCIIDTDMEVTTADMPVEFTGEESSPTRNFEPRLDSGNSDGKAPPARTEFKIHKKYPSLVVSFF